MLYTGSFHIILLVVSIETEYLLVESTGDIMAIRTTIPAMYDNSIVP